MSKDPAFLFYSSDWISGTMFLSAEQKGKFIDLLCAQHQKGRLRKKDMLHICKTYDEDIFCKFRRDSEGLYFNEKLEFEQNRRKAYSESRRNNRKKKDNPLNNISKTYVQHMETETETETITDTKTEIFPTFDDFWNLYDYKKNKPKSTTAWNKLKQKDKEAIMHYLPIYIQSTPDKAFRKHPTTFLNNRGWEDEITLKNETQQTNYDNLRRSISPALSVK